MDYMSTVNMVSKIPELVGTLEQVLLRLYALFDGGDSIDGLADFVHASVYISHELDVLPDIQVLMPVLYEQKERKLVGTWRHDEGKIVLSLTQEHLSVDILDLDGNIVECVG
jgi:hypothetical protein